MPNVGLLIQHIGISAKTARFFFVIPVHGVFLVFLLVLVVEALITS